MYFAFETLLFMLLQFAVILELILVHIYNHGGVFISANPASVAMPIPISIPDWTTYQVFEK